MSGASPPTPVELRALLAHLLAGAAGGTEEHWSELLGEPKRLSLAFSIKSNWSITPRGTVKERAAILRAIEIVQAEHPYLVW